MEKLTLENINLALIDYEIKCEPEHIPYVGNCSAIDTVQDEEQESWIRDQLDCGNEWAWCRVKVTASYESFTGTDTLGACSYRSKAYFMMPGGYYDDMKSEALDRLIEALNEARIAIDEIMLKSDMEIIRTEMPWMLTSEGE